MTARILEIIVEWDEEAGAWIATSRDVPGLCCEAATFDELMQVALALVPELLVANGVMVEQETNEVPVRFVAERQAVARRVA